MNIDNIEQKLNYIQRKLNERTAISNLSNFANIADKIQHGNISIEIDSVNKMICFGNGNNKLWFNVSSKTLNNITSIIVDYYSSKQKTKQIVLMQDIKSYDEILLYFESIKNK